MTKARFGEKLLKIFGLDTVKLGTMTSSGICNVWTQVPIAKCICESPLVTTRFLGHSCRVKISDEFFLKWSHIFLHFLSFPHLRILVASHLICWIWGFISMQVNKGFKQTYPSTELGTPQLLYSDEVYENWVPWKSTNNPGCCSNNGLFSENWQQDPITEENIHTTHWTWRSWVSAYMGSSPVC